ncbi:MAG TPA: PCRF domain-containing protein, partial [Candidatus Sumerlaeota bacterium]|nr:PCRF domain-containing protein [Candidatus Sumerlaeota bacterium]
MQALEGQTQSPNFWEDSEHAQTVMKKITTLKSRVEPWVALEKEVNDNLELAALLKEEGMEESDDAKSLIASTEELQHRFKKLELTVMLTGEEDTLPAFIKVQAGAGGTEAMDWAAMLLRMYTRWCEKNGYKMELMDVSDGEQAGIQSATIRVEGPYAFGYLKGEAGVHRLVRIS